MSNIVLPMRLWIALTGLMAIMQACQCFLGNFSFIAEKIYVLQPDQGTVGEDFAISDLFQVQTCQQCKPDILTPFSDFP